MKVLEVENLSKEYPKFKLKNVSFQIAEGEIMGFIGKNGAGKSTVMKAILNMINPSGGTIRLFNEDFRLNEQHIKQQMGVVFGGVEFYKQKKLSVLTAAIRRFYSEWNEEKYKGYLAEFDIDETKKGTELSMGMKVKYLIAVALSHNAKLLILDEPTSGLDPWSREEILTIFHRLATEEKVTIFFSTHVTSDLEKCADSITYIRDGKIICSERKADFIQHFDYLKKAGEAALTLEQIMIRSEGGLADA